MLFRGPATASDPLGNYSDGETSDSIQCGEIIAKNAKRQVSPVQPSGHRGDDSTRAALSFARFVLEKCEERGLSPTTLASDLVDACCASRVEGDQDDQPSSPVLQEVHTEEGDTSDRVGGRTKGTKRAATETLPSDTRKSKRGCHKKGVKFTVPTDDEPDCEADGTQNA